MSTNQNRDDDYPYIRMWGYMLGSMPYYITAQVEKARRDKAPQNATYYEDTTKRWNTTDDIANDALIAEWRLPNKPNKVELLRLLDQSILTGEAKELMKKDIESCDSFNKQARLIGLINNFIIQKNGTNTPNNT